MERGARFSTGALVALLLAAPERAHASPEDLFGYGARTQGMGMVGTAVAEGHEAAYANPALLGRGGSRRLALGFQGATFGLRAMAAGATSSEPVSMAAAKGAVVGIALPLPLGGPLRDRVGLGFGFYTPTDIIVRGRILYPETLEFPLLSDRAQSVTIRVGGGIDVGHGLRIGGGFAALAELIGNVLAATDATGKVGTRVETQLVATYAPVFGASYEVPLGSGTLRVGAAFRGELAARVAVAIDGTRLSTIPIPIFNIAGLAQYDPAQIALEAMLGLGRAEGRRHRHGLVVGLTAKRWSAYPGPLSPTILCPAEDPDCGALEVAKASFSDTLSVRFGYENRVPLGLGISLATRVGAALEPGPMSDKLPVSSAYDPGRGEVVSVRTGWLDGDRAAFTFGLGAEIDRPLSLNIDVFAQRHELLPRTHRAVESGVEVPTVTARGGFWVTGVTLGVGF